MVIGCKKNGGLKNMNMQRGPVQPCLIINTCLQCFLCHNSFSLPIYRTTAVAQWSERPPCEHKVMGSIPGSDRPKSLKLVVVAFPISAQDYGSSSTTGPPVSAKWTG